MQNFTSYIAGIPCQIHVISYIRKRANPRADNPDDYYGYTESEWEVLDRKGYRAKWIERKITPLIKDQIEFEIDEWMEQPDD